MNELSLFSGAGGGLLASKLLGWRTIGYVEFNRAPIFGDIRAFIGEGYADRYSGLVDVVSGGFPCQPFSVAGKQCAADDPRNMWPATLDVIRLVRPRFAFLENVPGLISGSHGYFGTILSDLAEIGYDARWTVLSAADCGAPHLRKRLWILCHPNGEGESTEPVNDESPGLSRNTSDAERNGLEREQSTRPEARTVDRGEGAYMANAYKLNRRSRARREDRPEACDGGWWQTEPNVGRVAHGVAARVDRLKAIGNGQVSIVAATAWRLLTK